ncbi:MAG: hypothetical protein V4526_00560 [Patescibacteria group bacterium]
MENLTKQQIILLALFVSFVSSIATGVVTVSLMDQSSQGVVQTITRVVERGIDKTGSDTKADAKQPEQQATENDTASVSSATAKALRSTVKIYRKVSGIDTAFYVGLGAVISKDGIVVTDRYNMVAQGRYVVVHNEREFPVEQISNTGNDGLAYLKTGSAENGSRLIMPASFAHINTLKLGQNVIMIQSGQNIAVKEGMIEAINTKSDIAAAAGTTVETVASNIDPKLTPSTSMLFSLAGELVGIKTANAARDGGNLFVPASIIKLSMPTFSSPSLKVEPQSETTEPTAATTSTTTAR